MSDWCDFCMEGAGMLAETTHMLDRMSVMVGVGRAYGGEDEFWPLSDYCEDWGWR